MNTPVFHFQVLRGAFGLLVALLFGVALVSLYRLGESATDENLFMGAPSLAVTTREIPADPVDIGGRKQVRAVHAIPPGAYLVKVGNVSIEKFEDLEDLPATDSARVVDVYLPKQSGYQRFFSREPVVWQSSARAVPPHVLVIDVTPGGASDRAGVRVGDRITAIDGQTFNGALEADRLMRLGGTSRNVAYDILREGEQLRLELMLARFGFPLGPLVMSLSGLICMGIAAFLLLKRPQINAARLVGLSLLAMGFVLAVATVQRDVTLNLFTVGRHFLMALSMYLIFPLSKESSTMFPREIPSLVARRRRVLPLYLLALLCAAGATALLWTGWPSPYLGFLVFGAGSFIMGVPTVVMWLFWRKHFTAEYRSMNRVIRWTGWIVLAVILVLLLLMFTLRPLFVSPQLVGIIGIPLLAIPLSFLYTIGRYRLLDLQLRVRRNVQYAVLSIFWAVLTISVLLYVLVEVAGLDIVDPRIRLVGMSIEISDRPAGGAGTDTGARWVLLGLGIFAFVGIWKLRGVGQSVIDRVFHRGRTDYSRAAAQLSEAFSTNATMMELGRSIAGRLVEVLRLKQSAVLFFRENGVCCCEQATGVDPEGWKCACEQINARFVAAVQKFRGEFRVEYLPAGIKESLLDTNFQYVIPIRSKERLIGVLLLGEKQSESPYTEDEMEFLAAAARQSAVAIENAFLYEELAETERMKHELHIARRIQLASLPQKIPVLTDLDLAGTSIPAREVGGDFFDFLVEGKNRVTVVVGDVSGKGTSAALYMAKVQGILRSLHAFHLAPSAMFSRANTLLRADLERSSFVTAIGAVFDADAGSVTVARAGHLPLYILRGAGTVERLITGGLGLGLDDDGMFASRLEERAVPIMRGDLFLFVSDGVTDARNPSGEEFGEERLEAFLRTAGGHSAAGVLDALLYEIERFSGGREADDDRTIVVVRFGKPAGATNTERQSPGAAERALPPEPHGAPSQR